MIITMNPAYVYMRRLVDVKEWAREIMEMAEELEAVEPTCEGCPNPCPKAKEGLPGSQEVADWLDKQFRSGSIK